MSFCPHEHRNISGLKKYQVAKRIVFLSKDLVNDSSEATFQKTSLIITHILGNRLIKKHIGSSIV